MHSTSRALPVALFVLAAVHTYLLMVAGRGWGGLSQPSLLGFTFNSMALNLLDGRFDVDPGTIRFDGFMRDGRTYAYFGIFPALLRLPLVPFVDLTSVSVEGWSRLLAGITGAGGLCMAVLALARCMPEGQARDTLRTILLAVALFSGPVVMLAMRSDIYTETILWAWAFCAWFLALLVPVLRAGSAPGARRLGALAAVAGCCLLTRPSTGFGLLFALAGVMIVLLAGRTTGSIAARARQGVPAALSPEFLWPVGIVLLAGGLAAVVNYGRWGNPFSFGDISLQEEINQFWPARIERLQRYGLFHHERLWLGLSYYFFPIWALKRDGRFIFQDETTRVLEGLELPPTSLFLTDPLTMVLAAAGALAVLRGRLPQVSTWRAIAALAGLAVPAAMMLVAWFMTFRYRVEFMPVLMVLAGLGALRVADWLPAAPEGRRRKAAFMLKCLLVAQILSAHAHALLYAVSLYGASEVMVTQDSILDHYLHVLGMR